MSTSLGGPPVNHSDPVNGRNQTIPVVPSTIINGNSSFSPDHSRKPSMMVTSAGATFNTNGGAQGKANNIQFGSMNAAGSPAMGTPPSLAHQPSASLGVNSLNPRGTSPQNSPSPIPQPVSVSGGRPPSSFQGQGNGLSFGQLPAEGSDNTNTRSGLAPQFTPQNMHEHMRRSSSQSMQSDMGTPSLPTGPGRGNFVPQRGRNNYTGGYQGQVNYSPNFRPNQNGRGMQAGYQGQGRHPNPYQGSPNLGTRSPMMHNTTPGTPQMAQMNMMPGMQAQPGGYPMGPYQGYGVPTAADPSIQYMYNTNYYQQPQMQGQFNQFPPPQSPRPPYQQPGYGTHMQPTYSNQGQVPPSMSRQSSQMSTTTTDRPSSSIGQSTHTPGISAPALSTRTPSLSAQKPDFTLPTKKSAAIQIKNSAGEVVTFSKTAPSSSATPPVPAPAIPTPPSRTPSAADHTRSESTVKTDEEKKKAMQEAVARKVAEEQAKARQIKEAAEQKAQMDKEAAELAEQEAAKAKAEAERLEQEAKEAAEAAEAAKAAREAQEAEEARKAQADKEAKEKEEAKKAEEQAIQAETSSDKKSASTAANNANDDIDFDAIEAELAAIEAEEARREEEYQKKKAAERQAKQKREEEEAAAYESNMKEMERKAEEEELDREKKAKEGGTEDEVAKKMFAALKSGGDIATPSSTADESPTPTPFESGAATPVSDSSMPPPKGLGPAKRGKIADLTLDTKKSAEPPEPSATLKALMNARRLEDPTTVDYPDGVDAPDSALNATAPADRKFKYNKEFLLQFQSVFKEKPSIDWDNRVREALGTDDANSARTGTARTPSGMGGRSGSTRASAAGGFPAMGSFGTGRPSLPPGTTSEQRFAASNAALRGAPMANPFAFGRPGSVGPSMVRTPSNNPLGQIPGSRGGNASQGGRAKSKQNKQNAKQLAEENKSMPLTAGKELAPIEVSATGWKPTSIGRPSAPGPVPGGDGHMEPAVVQRKVKAALNKMTPEKFEKIADQILDIAAQSKNESDGRTLRQVIQLTFEKATDEAHWAPMYAMFCRKMLQSMSAEVRDENIKDKNGEVVTGGNLFRKYLLNRCQEEFERGWKVNLPPRKEGETEEAALMSEEYYLAAAAKRRGLGLVKFIGELFKLGMLTERIMHECVKKLVDYEGTPDEAEVESLTSLLRTIGKQLDSPESRAQGRMDVYFERINQTIHIPDLPSRLRFMLMDVVDLRKNGWQSAADDKGPKTIQQIHEEAERAAQKAEMQRLANQTGGRGGGGSGRMPMGRGDARSFSGYGQVPPPDNSNRVGADDLRRLGGRASRNASSTAGPSLGPPSLLGGRTNSGRRGLGPGGLLSRGGEDSAASSRTGTPPQQKDKDKKDESSTNAFSALAGLDSHEGPSSNPSSPPTQKSQPNIERERSRSPENPTE